MKTWIVASELILSLCVCAANDAKVSATMVEKAKAAAAQGDATAQFRYAEMLRDGRGVAKDVCEAVVWTRKNSGQFLAGRGAGREVRGCVRRYLVKHLKENYKGDSWHESH